MNDDKILQRGGTERDIAEYAKQNGGDSNDTQEWRDKAQKAHDFEAAAQLGLVKKDNWDVILESLGADHSVGGYFVPHKFIDDIKEVFISKSSIRAVVEKLKKTNKDLKCHFRHEECRLVANGYNQALDNIAKALEL